MPHTGLPDEAPPAGFHLLRYFSMTSLAGILLAMVGLGWLYQFEAQSRLIAHQEQANANLTAMFANTVWQRHRQMVQAPATPARRTRKALLAEPGFPALRADVQQAMRGLSVVKVKLYDRHGDTFFSTDEQQMGENKNDNPGFQAALAGARASQLVHRDRMDSFEGTVTNIDLVSTYLPLRGTGHLGGKQGDVEAVIEVYSEVTDQVHAGVAARWRVVGAVLAALAVLYLFLLMLVRRAAGIIHEQHSEHAAQAAKLSHQAFHDALTGLPNRASFLQRLEAVAAKDSKRQFALLYIDLDRFKEVNDQQGHAAGDALLRLAAQRMQQCLRDGDRLYRMGGDEFTGLLPRVTHPEQARQVAQRVVEGMLQPFEVMGQTVQVGATVGVALFPADGCNPEALLHAADGAMYLAKQLGRGRLALACPLAEPAVPHRATGHAARGTHVGQPA